MREREEYVYRAPVEAAQQRQLRHPRFEYLVDVHHADGPVLVVDDDERRDLPLLDDAHGFDGEAVGERVYLSLINSAKHRLYMATPYLLIDEEMQNAICQAAKSGVDVRLLLPHIPDKKAVFNLTRSYYGPLMEAGVRIYEFTPGFVHEKMFIVDDSVGSVGTINLDYRSLYLHFENGTLLFGDPSIAKMRQDYLQSIEKSELITKERYAFLERKNKYYWAILRIIAPFL